MRGVFLLLSITFLPATATAQATLSPADRTAAFRAAGFKLQQGQWRACDDPGTPSYQPGRIETVRDRNGDSRPDVLITEGGTFCFGNTGTGYSLVSKQSDGSWKLITQSPGIPRFLDSRGVAGWPDIENGGPGFCFAVKRWDGREYKVIRYQYEGKPCRLSGKE